MSAKLIERICGCVERVVQSSESFDDPIERRVIEITMGQLLRELWELAKQESMREYERFNHEREHD